MCSIKVFLRASFFPLNAPLRSSTAHMPGQQGALTAQKESRSTAGSSAFSKQCRIHSDEGPILMVVCGFTCIEDFVSHLEYLCWLFVQTNNCFQLWAVCRKHGSNDPDTVSTRRRPQASTTHNLTCYAVVDLSGRLQWELHGRVTEETLKQIQVKCVQS